MPCIWWVRLSSVLTSLGFHDVNRGSVWLLSITLYGNLPRNFRLNDVTCTSMNWKFSGFLFLYGFGWWSLSIKREAGIANGYTSLKRQQVTVKNCKLLEAVAFFCVIIYKHSWIDCVSSGCCFIQNFLYFL